MKEEIKEIYKGKTHTTSLTFNGTGFQGQQLLNAAKTHFLTTWNSQQTEEDHKFSAGEIKVIDAVITSQANQNTTVQVKWEVV